MSSLVVLPYTCSYHREKSFAIRSICKFRSEIHDCQEYKCKPISMWVYDSSLCVNAKRTQSDTEYCVAVPRNVGQVWGICDSQSQLQYLPCTLEVVKQRTIARIIFRAKKQTNKHHHAAISFCLHFKRR